jgi:hypothetical protein
VQPAFKSAYEDGEKSGKDKSLAGARFFEVECRQSQPFCQMHQAGMGGWPTVKHFNAATGIDGGRYKQLTTQSVCDELKAGNRLREHVAEQVAVVRAAPPKAKGGGGNAVEEL